jgi:hypothetical protein
MLYETEYSKTSVGDKSAQFRRVLECSLVIFLLLVDLATMLTSLPLFSLFHFIWPILLSSCQSFSCEMPVPNTGVPRI